MPDKERSVGSTGGGSHTGVFEAVSHYCEADRTALHEIFKRLPGAIPVACRGSDHGGDPSDWHDHELSKAPFLHAAGTSYKWKMPRNVELIRRSLDLLPLVGIGLESARLFALDDDRNADTPPIQGVVGIPSRNPAHQHWLGRKGPGAWRDIHWVKGTSGGEVKQKGFICLWHPQAFLEALDALRHCAPVEWAVVQELDAKASRNAGEASHPGPRYRSIRGARDAFQRQPEAGDRHVTMRSATASLVVRGIDPSEYRDVFLSWFDEHDRAGRAEDFDRAVRMARDKVADGSWTLRAMPDIVFDAAWEKPVLPEAVPLHNTGRPKAQAVPRPTNSKMLAEAFVHAGRCRDFVKLDSGQWYRWNDGFGWQYDANAPVLTGLLQDFGAEVFHWKQVNKRTGRETLRLDPLRGGQHPLAKQALAGLPMFEGVARRVADSMRCPSLLGLPGGQCVDLNTGHVRAMERDDLLLAHCPVAPEDVAGRIIVDVVHHLFGDSLPLAVALFGGMLWGVPMGRYIVLLPGVTKAGKSTFLKLLGAALGPYATMLSSDVLTTRASGDIQFNVENANAKLRGVRVAVMSELPRRRRLDPARINELTGGDVLVGRQAGGNLHEFPASHSMVFAMNDLPGIDVEASPETAQALFTRLRPFHVGKPMPDSLGRDAHQAMRDPQGARGGPGMAAGRRRGRAQRRDPGSGRHHARAVAVLVGAGTRERRTVKWRFTPPPLGPMCVRGRARDLYITRTPADAH